jgi:hypothetical protein
MLNPRSAAWMMCSTWFYNGGRNYDGIQVRVVEQVKVVGIKTVSPVTLRYFLGHFWPPAGNSVQVGVWQLSNVARPNFAQ